MTGAGRLARVAERLERLHEEAKSDLERQYIEEAAAELARDAEIRLISMTGFALRLIREEVGRT